MSLQLVPKWIVDKIFNFGKPALFNGTMILGSMGTIGDPGNCRAVRIADGIEVWTFPAASDIRGAVLVDKGTVYFSGISMTQPNNVQHSFLYAVDAQTGIQRWRTNIDSWLDLQLMDEQFLYFTASKDLIPGPKTSSDITYLVITVDKATGVVKSSVDIGPGLPMVFRFRNDELLMAREDFQKLQFVDPRTMQTKRTYEALAKIIDAALNGNRCYLVMGPDSDSKYRLTALNLDHLTEEWTQVYPFKCASVFASGDVLAITVGSPAGTAAPRYFIQLLDPANGLMRWSYEAGNRVSFMGIIMRGNLLVQARFRPELMHPKDPEFTLTVALDLRNGREVFRVDHPYSTGWVIDAGDDLAIANHVEYILALDTTRFWKIAVTGAIRSAPIKTSTGIVFGNADGRLICIAMENGRERWNASLPSPIEGQAAVANGRVFVGHRNGVTALDELNGHSSWISNTPNPVTSAINVYGNAVVFGARDGQIRAVSVDDGSPMWQFATSGFVEGGVSFDGQKYYSGSADGMLYALDTSGKKAWIFSPMDGTIDEIKSMPLVAGQTVVFGNAGGHLYALDTADGHLLWQIRLNGSLKTSSALLHTDHFWIGDASGHVYRIALANGNVEWATAVSGPVLGRPAWSFAELYVGTMSSEMAVLDIWTGHVLRTVVIGAPVFASPLATPDAIFVADEDGGVHALVPGV